MIFKNKMFFRIFLFASCIQTISNFAEQPPVIIVPPSAVINNISNHSSPVLTASLANIQDIAHIIHFKFPNFTMPAVFQDLPNASTALYDYKWHIAGTVLSAAYLYLNFKIYTINQLLEDQKSWSLWKEEIPMNRLTTLDQIELFKQLKIDICKKYFNVIDTTKESEVLAKFLQDINNEKKLLEFYQSIHKASHTLYVSRLFVSTKSLEQIAQYIARLNFLIDLYVEVFIQSNDITKKT